MSESGVTVREDEMPPADPLERAIWCAEGVRELFSRQHAEGARQELAELRQLRVDYKRLDRIASEQEDTITLQAKRVAGMEAEIARLQQERDALQATVNGWAGVMAAHTYTPYIPTIVSAPNQKAE